ncbi:hypothetical protein Tco_1262634 [Tanacetum coccineum]
MTTLKFIDTHNMVTFLSKPTESDGFEQIVDFLNAHPIRYALTINPTIYISCIEQFWSTVKAKTINGEVQLHALVDGKKIIITESSVRRDLQLEDEEGVDCLPNSTIFKQLTLMGPKTTAWNEFSSTMASAIICLATNQKFNFSKFIFESMIRNLDNLSGKFLMYPRFVQVFLDQQLDGMPTHKRIYIAPSHTKKIFGNMRRVGKGFSGRVTPLFQTMVVQNQSQLGEGSAIPTDPHHTPTFIQPSTQPQKTQQPRKPKRKDTQVPQSSDPIENVADEAVHKELGDRFCEACTHYCFKLRSGAGQWFESVSKHSNDSLLARGNTLQSDEDRLKLDEWMALCTTLKNHVLDLEKIKTTQHNGIASLKRRVKKLKKKDSVHDVNVFAGKEVFFAEQDVVEVINTTKLITDAAQVSASTTTTATIKTVDDITLAQVLEEMKSTNPKKKGIVIQELGESTTTISSQLSSQQSQDKGKGILIEPVKPMNKKDLIMLDEETPLNLQAEFDEEERLAREKAKKEEANIALIKTWDINMQRVMLDTMSLAKRLQAQEQEQEELSIEENATLFQKLLEKRRKHFAAKRAEEKRNKPPTKAQQTELKQLMKIIPNKDEVAIDAIPLAVNQMLKSFDNEDLEYLYKLVKAKYESTRPVEYLDLLLWGDMKTMFEPHVEDKATIQDGRVIGQHVQGRQTQCFVGTRNIRIAITSRGNYAAGQAKVVKCYNCLREEVGQILDEEQLAFIADPGIAEVQVAQQTIPQNSAFQTEDLDAYDSDCDDISSAKAVLMANLSSCDSDVLSEVPYSDTYLNDMINQDVQEMPYSEQTHIMDFLDNEITSDSNIIPYSQYLQESQDAGIQDTNSSAPNDLLVLSLVEQMTDHVANLDKENQTNKMVNESLTAELERYKERVAIFEQRLNVDLNKREKLIDSQMDDLIRNRNAKFAAFQQEIDTLKETLSNHVKEKESLSTTLTVFKTESKEKESKYIDKEIVLEKQNKELENILSLGYQNPFYLKKAQRIKPTLYDGSVIAKEHDVISVIDDEETLILEEESRSKMLDKQNDPISIK